MSILSHITGGYRSTAKVVDNTLVLSLPDALLPVVWRMDLGTAKSSAIEVRDNDENGYDLVLKTPQTDAHTIATYAIKIRATQALMAVTKAMKRAEGQLPVIPLELSEEDRSRYLPVPVTGSSKPKMTWWRWVLSILKYLFITLSVIIVLGTAWQFWKLRALQPQLSNSIGLQQGNTGQVGRAGGGTFNNFNPSPPVSQTGEIMSADDFLNGQ